jgi:hypothetical protein
LECTTSTHTHTHREIRCCACKMFQSLMGLRGGMCGRPILLFFPMFNIITAPGLTDCTYYFKYNQQDATLHNILYYYQRSTCSRRLLRPSSGAQSCTHSIWYMSSLLASSASSKQASLTYTRCCVYSFELLTMGGEAVWNMYSIDSNK